MWAFCASDESSTRELTVYLNRTSGALYRTPSFHYPYGYGKYAEYCPRTDRGYYRGGCYPARQRMWIVYGYRNSQRVPVLKIVRRLLGTPDIERGSEACQIQGDQSQAGRRDS
jgi:hypothetical protein